MPAPIFIIGIAPRSGTNYLYNAIALHPRCTKSSVHGEDFLLYNSELLIQYAKRTHKLNGYWNNGMQALIDSIETGLISYLGSGLQISDDAIIVCKTPHTHGVINIVTNNFTKSKVIILVRAGQAVADSYVKSFNSDYDWIMRKWNRGANDIFNLQKICPHLEGTNYLIIRYEDLIAKESETIGEILNFCGLSSKDYDFSALTNLGVYGSSTFHNGEITWTPVVKTSEFRPQIGASNWSVWRTWRFNWIAGENSSKLGYTLEKKHDRNPFYYIYNIAADCYEALIDRINKITFFFGKRDHAQTE